MYLTKNNSNTVFVFVTGLLSSQRILWTLMKGMEGITRLTGSEQKL